MHSQSKAVSYCIHRWSLKLTVLLWAVAVSTVQATTINFSTFPAVEYQVQYTTNLAPANWINLSSVITGANPATNNFWRIRSVP